LILALENVPKSSEVVVVTGGGWRETFEIHAVHYETFVTIAGN